MQGPQTAIVVGVSGEEIDTDEFGRVKVQFRWDRLGKGNENSSCWVRVAQVWAGSAWGGMAIPRVGQEVIVDFIEGDPDRPIVTGRVYNADNMPPYPLPDKKTVSTIKSRSTKSGAADNFNEIRIEDKKGEEEIYIHAEKDHNTLVENNQSIKVGFDKHDKGDRLLQVKNDETIEIGHDRTMTVGHDKTETVNHNKTIDVKGNHGEGIKGNMTITVAKNLTEAVTLNYSENVGAAMELTVGGAMAETIGANKTQSIGHNSSSDVNNDLTLNVGKNYTEKIGENYTSEIEKDAAVKVGGKLANEVTKDFSISAAKVQVVANDEIVIKTGSAEISMKKNGDITIKGNNINIKGSGDVILKGSQIKEN